MKLSTWIAVGALNLLPLGLAHAEDPKPGAAVVKAVPAAPSGSASAADGGAAKPAKRAASKTPKASQGAAAVSGEKGARAAGKPAKAAAAEPAKPPVAPAAPEREQLAQAPQPALRLTGNPPPPPAAGDQPVCSLAEPEQPRGGRLEVLGERIGSAPVVRIAGKPARMIERRNGRISVQIPADSDGGPISLQNDGKQLACGNLVIIGKNR